VLGPVRRTSAEVSGGRARGGVTTAVVAGSGVGYAAAGVFEQLLVCGPGLRRGDRDRRPRAQLALSGPYGHGRWPAWHLRMTSRPLVRWMIRGGPPRPKRRCGRQPLGSLVKGVLHELRRLPGARPIRPSLRPDRIAPMTHAARPSVANETRAAQAVTPAALDEPRRRARRRETPGPSRDSGVCCRRDCGSEFERTRRSRGRSTRLSRIIGSFPQQRCRLFGSRQPRLLEVARSGSPGDAEKPAVRGGRSIVHDSRSLTRPGGARLQRCGDFRM
jgi:hypothetical protein